VIRWYAPGCSAAMPVESKRNVTMPVTAVTSARMAAGVSSSSVIVSTRPPGPVRRPALLPPRAYGELSLRTGTEVWGMARHTSQHSATADPPRSAPIRLDPPGSARSCRDLPGAKAASGIRPET
jgi:hypothetical protein